MASTPQQDVVSQPRRSVQYLGDGIVIYVGYPQAQEDASERAVRTGLEILAAVSELRAPGGIQIEVRLGAATGIAVGPRCARSQETLRAKVSPKERWRARPGRATSL